MIIRIVQMTFQPEEIAGFLESFHANKTKIRNFEGCEHLELLRDIDRENVFFTYSYWQSSEHLDTYRRSDLFRGVWKQTSARFAAKPKAWSVDRMVELP